MAKNKDKKIETTGKTAAPSLFSADELDKLKTMSPEDQLKWFNKRKIMQEATDKAAKNAAKQEEDKATKALAGLLDAIKPEIKKGGFTGIRITIEVADDGTVKAPTARKIKKSTSKSKGKNGNGRLAEHPEYLEAIQAYLDQDKHPPLQAYTSKTKDGVQVEKGFSFNGTNVPHRAMVDYCCTEGMLDPKSIKEFWKSFGATLRHGPVVGNLRNYKLENNLVK